MGSDLRKGSTVEKYLSELNTIREPFQLIPEWIKEFWRYRELLYIFVWRDVKVRYKQTVLGAMWAVIQPFFTMVVFTLFFGKLIKIPSDDIPYPIFSYSALLPWTYFSTALALAGNSMLSHAGLLQKIYFPRLAIPMSQVLGGLIDFFIASVLLIGLMIYYHVPVSRGLLLWPFLILLLVVLALGCGMLLASINVKYRDIKHVIPFGIQLWLFVTPIIYPMSIIPNKYHALIALNPLTGLIEAFRSSLFPYRKVDWGLLSISIVMTTFIFICGLVYFRKTEKYFADII